MLGENNSQITPDKVKWSADDHDADDETDDRDISALSWNSKTKDKDSNYLGAEHLVRAVCPTPYSSTNLITQSFSPSEVTECKKQDDLALSQKKYPHKRDVSNEHTGANTNENLSPKNQYYVLHDYGKEAEKDSIAFLNFKPKATTAIHENDDEKGIVTDEQNKTTTEEANLANKNLCQMVKDRFSSEDRYDYLYTV